ncbi:DNA polymerase III subunit gamma/tau [bacterium]|nr:DNA polymerase III subunit gamma/tau [bacterium]MBU1990743.1 DNA polymerase III subunit gamma/tau [bacterium]
MKASSEVLARKYRPSNFDELIGQETISQTLSLALDSNRLSHAYLFSGLRGSGKTSTARIFAKALICEKGVTHQPCGICQNCIMALEGRHMDIVEMDAASSRKIDDIRDLIEQTKYKPASARFKIFIIDEVHMLTKEAFNALLKTLEEPPAYVKFILATTDPLKLPATILSRTQHFRFKNIATNKIIDHLAHILRLEEIEYENDALEILARSGNGSLRDTLTLLDQAIIYSKNHVDVRTVTDMLGLVDPKFIADLFNAIFAKDYAQIVKYTKFLEDYEAEMVADELIAYLKERMYNQDAVFSTLVLDRFFRILSDAKSLFSINADGSFVLSLIFFKMVEALRIKEVDQMIESLQKNMKRPEINTQQPKTANMQTPSAPLAQEEIPEQTPPQAIEEAQETPETDKELPAVLEPQSHPHQDMFDDLTARIKDRNYELGSCFEKSVTFISYSDAILSWESCADAECKQSLKHGYSVIKQLVREVFGFSTKIKGLPCTKAPEEEKKNDEITKIPSKIQQPSMQEPQGTSMIEDAEIGGSASCVTGCSQSDESTKEFNGIDITDEPMVQKAIEMFEANKVTIQSKI